MKDTKLDPDLGMLEQVFGSFVRVVTDKTSLLTGVLPVDRQNTSDYTRHTLRQFCSFLQGCFAHSFLCDKRELGKTSKLGDKRGI